MAVEVMEDTFEKEVLQSRIPVLAYFYLPSCAKCVVMMFAAEGLKKRKDRKLKLAKFNMTKNQGLAKNLAVFSTPTFIIYKDGKEMERFYGERLNMDDMEDLLQKAT